MKNKLTLIVSLLIVLVVVFCNCQKSPVAVPISPGFSGTVGEGSQIDDRDVTETKVESTNIQNSTWMILGLKIIDTVKFLVIFIVCAIAVYKWVSKGKFGWLGDGR